MNTEEILFYLYDKETGGSSKPFKLDWLIEGGYDLEMESGETLPLSDFKVYRKDFEIHLYEPQSAEKSFNTDNKSLGQIVYVPVKVEDELPDTKEEHWYMAKSKQAKEYDSYLFKPQEKQWYYEWQTQLIVPVNVIHTWLKPIPLSSVKGYGVEDLFIKAIQFYNSENNDNETIEELAQRFLSSLPCLLTLSAEEILKPLECEAYCMEESATMVYRNDALRAMHEFHNQFSKEEAEALPLPEELRFELTDNPNIVNVINGKGESVKAFCLTEEQFDALLPKNDVEALPLQKEKDELWKEVWGKLIEILYDANGTGSGADDIISYLKQHFTVIRK